MLDDDERLGDRHGCLLRAVVADTHEGAVSELSRELGPVGRAVSGGGERVQFAVEGEGRDGDRGACRRPALRAIEAGVARDQAEPPAVLRLNS